jgi:hypothetical protein
MDKKLRFLFLITLVLMMIGTLPSNMVLAGTNQASNYQSAGANLLTQIKNNPCGNGNLYTGDINFVACSGWAGETSWITVPLSYWETTPEYPLVNYPFYLYIGTVPANRPGTGSPYSFPRRDVTFPQVIAIDGLRTEIQLVTVKKSSTFLNWNYNGQFNHQGSMTILPGAEFRNYYGDPLDHALSVFEDPSEPTSASQFIPYYVGGVNDYLKLKGIVGMSSYHAPSQATYRGEPAYRLELISSYEFQARVTYQNYRLWERIKVGERTVCRPGPNNAGGYDCLASVGNWYEPGHSVTLDIYEWKWGPYRGGGSSGWVTVPIDVDVNSVLAPNGVIYDHIPIAVYQSQPILQLP